MPSYPREAHAAFLDAELEAQIMAFQRKLESSAVSLLENGDIFVAQFIKLRGAEMLVKMNTERRGVPRRLETMRAMLVKDSHQSWRSWGIMTYGELIRTGQLNYSDATCIWHHRADDPSYTLVGFRSIDIEFADALVEGCVVIFGPPEPPFQYLANLKRVVQTATVNSGVNYLLDLELVTNDWLPVALSAKVDLLHDQLHLSEVIIVQGPPGTGKTHLLAQLAAKLLDEGKRVLATSLTHRALFELSSKEALKPALNQKRLYKRRLTLDDKAKLPDLQEAEDLFAAPGCLTLATFYATSGWATQVKEMPYDVVLVDEASQAFLAMLAASRMLAPKVLWIGDPAQLPPVVVLSADNVTKYKAQPLIDGMKTALENLSFPAYRLVETYRLTRRAALFTGLFYQNTLVAAEHPNRPALSFQDLPAVFQNILHPEGGPTLLALPLPPGDPAPGLLIKTVAQLVAGLMTINEEQFSITILAKQRKTVSLIQWSLVQIFGYQENIFVETVERVQGLTCDICIFVMPDANLHLSLDPNFFNVATSRARRHTIIVAAERVLQSATMDIKVATFLERLSQESRFNMHLYLNG